MRLCSLADFPNAKNKKGLDVGLYNINLLEWHFGMLVCCVFLIYTFFTLSVHCYIKKIYNRFCGSLGQTNANVAILLLGIPSQWGIHQQICCSHSTSQRLMMRDTTLLYSCLPWQSPYLNSSAPGGCDCNLELVAFKLISWSDILSICNKIALSEYYKTSLMMSQHWFS